MSLGYCRILWTHQLNQGTVMISPTPFLLKRTDSFWRRSADVRIHLKFMRTQLIFNISECKNRRQLVPRAVCVSVNTYSLWKEKPQCDRLLKSCQTAIRHIYLHLFVIFQQRITKRKQNSFLSNNALDLLWSRCSSCELVSWEIHLPSVTVSPPPEMDSRLSLQQLDQQIIHRVSA